jgi:ferredoxin
MNYVQACRCVNVCLNERKDMANKNERLSQNVPGFYYVDATCIDCDMCRGNAPDFFRRDDDIGYSVVYRQPETPEQYALAEEARENCPTDSIGNDGVEVAENHSLNYKS